MRALNYVRSTTYAQLHAAILCGLVVCCGLLAKWLRISAMVRVRAGARECIICTFFSLWLFVSVVIDDIVQRRITYEYSIGDVTKDLPSRPDEQFFVGARGEPGNEASSDTCEQNSPGI